MTGVPLEIERKLLIEEPDLAVLEAAATSVSEIVQTYLVEDGWDAERVRRRQVRDAAGEHLRLTYTRKRGRGPGVVEEDEREIDEDTYLELLARTDTDRVPIVKTRYVVPWAGLQLEIDRFISPRSLWLLEVELDDADRLHDELELPSGYRSSVRSPATRRTPTRPSPDPDPPQPGRLTSSRGSPAPRSVIPADHRAPQTRVRRCAAKVITCARRPP